MADIASDKPKYKGSAYCESCHAEQFAAWSKGVHNRRDIGKIVRCEVCHGAAGERDVGACLSIWRPARIIPKPEAGVPTDTRKLCTLCHEKMTGRPVQQRQIVVAEHAGTQQCTVCHNPHSPKLDLAHRHRRRSRAMRRRARPRPRLAPAVTAARASASTSPGPASPDRTRPIWSKPSRHTARARATIP